MPKKELKEDYEIIIKEINRKSEVKDINFTLNTAQSGKASFVTKKINGELDAFIISAPKPVSIKVSLDEYKDLVLFKILKITGDYYLPIRSNAVSSEGIDFKFTQEKYILNNKLRFEVKGGFNTDVNIVVRYR